MSSANLYSDDENKGLKMAAAAEADNTVPKSVLVPPPLYPLNTQSDDMIKEWEYWERSFERYCRMTGQENESQKQDILFAYIGRELEEFLRNLPNFNQLNTTAHLLEAVRARYTKTPNVLCERLNFRKVKMNPGESVNEFNLRLNGFSKNCNFDNYSRDLAHLDQILLNCVPSLREKLLLEKNLTLDRAVEIAKHASEGTKWADTFNETSVAIKKEVNFSRSKNNSKYPRGKYTNKVKSCYRCGSNNHLANDKKCPAVNAKCKNCTKIGHFAKYCLTKSKVDSSDEKNVKQISSSEYTDNCGHFNVLRVSSGFSTSS